MKNLVSFPSDLFEYLDCHTLVGIKGGRDRESFLNIWMVVVGDRFFSRSWNKSNKSWFTAFLSTGVGQIKYAETVLDVQGRKLPPNDPLHEHINRAYLEKYDQPENLSYSRGITQSEYRDYTMEFIIDQ